MTKWIRWPGLIVFIAVLVLLVSFIYLFSGIMVKKFIENSGTELVGARVELDKVSLTVMPLRIEIKNLRVTNPDFPMQNAVQVERIKFFVDTSELLRLNIVLDEMGVDNVRLNTRRRESGVIKNMTKKIIEPDEIQGQNFSLPKIELSDVNSILSKEKLKTLELAEIARVSLNDGRKRWDYKIKSLPGKSVFSAYEDKIKSIKPAKTGDAAKDIQALSSALNELNKIKKNIRQDINQIKAAKSELNQDIKTFRSQYNKLLKTLTDDYVRLKEKYSPSSVGLSNYSRVLFGNTVIYWVNIALDWYRRLSPVFLNVTDDEPGNTGKNIRHQGINVHFMDNIPMPDFLIRSVNMSLELDVGNIRGEINNITSDQEILGLPLNFSFFADKLENAGALELVGTMDHTDPDQSVDKVNFSLTSYKVKNFTLSENETLKLSLKQAQSNLQSEVKLKGRVLTASILSTVQSADFVTRWYKNPGDSARSMERVLKNIHAFDIKVNIIGSKEKYNVQVSSDLDEIIENAIAGKVEQSIAEFDAQLKDRINTITKGEIADLESLYKKVNKLQNTIDEIEILGNKYLKLVEDNEQSLIKENEIILREKMDNLSDRDKEKIDTLKQKYNNLFK